MFSCIKWCNDRVMVAWIFSHTRPRPRPHIRPACSGLCSVASTTVVRMLEAGVAPSTVRTYNTIAHSSFVVARAYHEGWRAATASALLSLLPDVSATPIILSNTPTRLPGHKKIQPSLYFLFRGRGNYVTYLPPLNRKHTDTIGISIKPGHW